MIPAGAPVITLEIGAAPTAAARSARHQRTLRSYRVRALRACAVAYVVAACRPKFRVQCAVRADAAVERSRILRTQPVKDSDISQLRVGIARYELLCCGVEPNRNNSALRCRVIGVTQHLRIAAKRSINRLLRNILTHVSVC
jgi:hypothetical protein